MSRFWCEDSSHKKEKKGKTRVSIPAARHRWRDGGSGPGASTLAARDKIIFNGSYCGAVIDEVTNICNDS